MNSFIKTLLIILCFGTWNKSIAQTIDCPFEGCHCVNNPVGDDITVDCVSTEANREFPRRSNESLTNSTRNISLLIFYGYELDHIPDNSFANLSIKYLHLVSTNLRQILTNTFKDVQYLEELVIYGGNLEVIEKDAFQWVKDTLRKLDLSNCKLNSTKMDQFSIEMKPLYWLKYFYLAENNFTELKYRWFNSFQMVKELNLAKNGIEHVPDDVFKSNKFLRVIDLSSNNIEKFPTILTKSSVFSFRFSLQVIKLNQNRLKVIEQFSDLEELLDLDLSENQIEEIEYKTFRKLINLERLRLSSNSIRFIETDAFETLTRLRGLFLENNYLSSLPSLSGLNELITLNIENQNGKLITLKDFSFDTQPKIERYNNMVVYMRSNLVTSFSDKAFCSRGNQTSGIDVIFIDYDAIRNMDRCMLKQLKKSNQNGYPVYVIISDENINDSTDVSIFSEVCNCENFQFAQQNGVNIVGICRLLDLSCEEEKEAKIDDDCDSRTEFQCHV